MGRRAEVRAVLSDEEENENERREEARDRQLCPGKREGDSEVVRCDLE